MARLFELHRDSDVTGVSGTGVVAEGTVRVGGNKRNEPRRSAMKPTLGRIVLYRLSEQDCAILNARTGHGNTPRPGDQCAIEFSSGVVTLSWLSDWLRWYSTTEESPLSRPCTGTTGRPESFGINSSRPAAL